MGASTFGNRRRDIEEHARHIRIDGVYLCGNVDITHRKQGSKEHMFYPDWYTSISKPFRDETAIQVINVLDRALVIGIAGIYVIAIAVMIVTGDALRALRVIIVPAATFGLVTYLRDRFDAPRPYELYPIDPIIAKDTHGKSMPSRHVASAVIIAFALAWIHLDWGVVAFVASAVFENEAAYQEWEDEDED